MNTDKPLTAIEFEKKYPEVQSRRAKFSQLRTNTFNFGTVNTGTIALPNNGDFALQVNAGSVVLTAKFNGTTFLFSPNGTI
jgi:hypothetical protein